MALRWNDIQAQRRARNQALLGTPLPPSTPVVNEAVSKIDVGGTTFTPEWRVEGITPLKADAVTGVIPVVPIERFPNRGVNPAVPLDFKFLNANLDTPIIQALGLTFAGSDWVGYYPLLQSDTNVWTNPDSKPLSALQGLVVGQETVFNITTAEFLQGTSYIPGTVVYGVDVGNIEGVRWTGVVLQQEDVNTLEITVTQVTGEFSVDTSNPQDWYISNNFDVIEQL